MINLSLTHSCILHGQKLVSASKSHCWVLFVGLVCDKNKLIAHSCFVSLQRWQADWLYTKCVRRLGLSSRLNRSDLLVVFKLKAGLSNVTFRLSLIVMWTAEQVVTSRGRLGLQRTRARIEGDIPTYLEIMLICMIERRLTVTKKY